ncbi:zinc finger protein 714 isoform X4 [Aplysia californica]|uniref:Zinc finger protein 714 isoform X4 n=1 Tax=Aplysia californica TaxID=6500 RepID=A0ABM1A2W2_APLCA|nr:zinc finger protein 714 isoform X4 [Aplysia californica]
MADISYTSKQMDANCEEDTTITMYRLNSGNDNGSGCVKTCDLFVPCSSGEGVNLGIDSIVVKSELTSSSGTRSRSSTSTGTLCTNSLREDVKKHDIIIVIGRESESVGVDEEHLSVKEEPSFECLCDVKAETNDKLNVESESSLTLRHSVVKDEPICTEEEDVKPVIKPECLTDICTVKTEPLFGHFPDFGDEVRPKVENFVKEEVSEWEGPDFGEVGKTEGQVGDVEDTCAEPVFVEDHMSQAGGLQLKISNVRSLCMEQSASPDTDVVASSSPTSTFSSDPVTSSGSVVRASWDHGESSVYHRSRWQLVRLSHYTASPIVPPTSCSSQDVSTSPHWPLTSGHPVQQTSDMQRRQGQSSSCRFQTGQRVYEENVGSVRKETSSGDIGAVERVCDLHQNIAGDKQMDNRNLYEECDMSLNDCAFASEAKADDIGVESDVCKIVSQTGPGNRLNVSSKHESGGKSRMSCDSKQSMGQGPDFNLSCAKSFASCMNSTESSSTTPPKVYKEMGAGCQVVPRSLVRESRYSGEQPHKCNVCLEMFTELGDLQRHKRTYTIDRPCKCEVCGVTFTCSSSLHKHKRIHSGEKSYKCEVCGATFAYGSDLQRHKRIHSGKKRYQCEVCGVTFASSSNLQKHKRIHRGEKPYKCEVCGATFTQNGNLQSHKRIHTGEKPYKCEVCGATFTFSSNLRNHKRIHTREKLYKCDICGVGFTESGNLQTHKRIHTGEKPYKCEVCGATFTLSSNLQSHERIHTGEKA